MDKRSTPITCRARDSFWGNALISAGAVSTAFGAVGWISAIRNPSILALTFEVLVFGALPLVGGIGLVWHGLEFVEDEVPSFYQRTMSPAMLLDAVRDGATSAEVARRLGLLCPRDIETELDGLVLEDLLEIEVTEEGELIYHAAGLTRPPRRNHGV